MALEVDLCTCHWNVQHAMQDPPSEVDARTALGDHLMGSVPSVGMVPIGLEGATGIVAAHPSRSTDDLQKPTMHLYCE